MNDMNRVRTYPQDVPLLRELGLEPFNVDLRVKHFVGEVKYGESYVKIWVTGYPAQFFTFEVFSAESGKKYQVETGSGSLSNYWPAINQMMNDMFVITPM